MSCSASYIVVSKSRSSALSKMITIVGNVRPHKRSNGAYPFREVLPLRELNRMARVERLSSIIAKIDNVRRELQVSLSKFIPSRTYDGYRKWYSHQDYLAPKGMNSLNSTLWHERKMLKLLLIQYRERRILPLQGRYESLWERPPVMVDPYRKDRYEADIPVVKSKPIRKVYDISNINGFYINCPFRIPLIDAVRNPALLIKLRNCIRQLRMFRLGQLSKAELIISLKYIRFAAISPQMESSKEAGETTSRLDEQGNVVLASEGIPSTSRPDTVCSTFWNSLSSTEQNHAYEYMTDRWLYIREFEWTSDLPQNAPVMEKMVLPYYAIINNEDDICRIPNFLPFNVHRYCSTDMEIKILINSTSFQVGQLQFSWLYSPQQDKGVSYRENIWSLSQANHVLLSAGASNEAILYIPYKYIKPYINCKLRKDILDVLNIGCLYGYVLNSLSVPSGQLGKCSGSIFIRFVRSSFSGMLAGDIDHVVISSQMDRMATLGAELVLNQLFPDRNRDNPPNISNPNVLIPTVASSWCAGTGISESVNPLRLDLRGQTSHIQLDDNDMTVNAIANIFGLVSTFAWNITQDAGTLIAAFEAQPMMSSDSYHNFNPAKGSDYYAFPPIAVLSSMFGGWRGPIDLRFDTIASKFHNGKLLLAYIPGAVGQSITLRQARASPHVTFDIGDIQQLLFQVPYIADTPYWERKYAGNYVSQQRLPPSYVYVYVLNKLVSMQSISDTVSVNVYMRGGPGFELLIPVQPSVGLCYNNDVLPNSSTSIIAVDGYFPYYAGTWQYFVGNKAIFRWNSTADTIAHFKTPLSKLSYYKIIDIKFAPTMKIEGKIVRLEYAYFWNASDHGYVVGVPFLNESNAISFVKGFENGKSPAELTNYLLDVTSNNEYCNGNPVWRSIPIPNDFDFTYIDFQIGEERSNVDVDISAPTGSLLSTRSGMLLYGEGFHDLKDYVRRYQLYGKINLSITKSMLETPGLALVSIPILPQGLELDIGTVAAPLEIANRCRDGHIPIICSGYRFYRGGIRFRIITANKNINLWVQHRPDRKLLQRRISIFKSIDNGNQSFNHSYASFVQNLSINNVITVEIPFYMNSQYGFLQQPVLTDKAEGNFSSLGELVMGIDGYFGKTSDVTLPITIFYSMADDMSFTTFQGFPPMILLDDIDHGVHDILPQGLMDYIMSPITNVKDNMAQKAADAIITIQDTINKVASEHKIMNTDFLKEHTFISAITQLVHCIISPCAKTMAWAFASFFLSIGIITLDLLSRFVEVVSSIFNRILGLFKSEKKEQDSATAANTSTNVHGVPVSSTNNDALKNKEDVVSSQSSQETNVVAQGLIDTFDEAELSSFASLCFVGIATALGSAISPPKSMKSFVSGLTASISNVTRATNYLTTFFKNSFGMLSKIFNYIMGREHPLAYIYNQLNADMPTIKLWAEEVLYLTDPRREFELQGGAYADRVYDACTFGGMMVMMTLEKKVDNFAGLRLLYDKIMTKRDNLTAMGINPYIRKEPFVIWVSGAPGIGKSFISEAITTRLLKRVGIRTSGPKTMVLQPTGDFWSGCKNQPVLYVDDMFAVTIDASMERQCNTMFMVKSNCVLNPPMARIEDKELRYNPEIFYINSNSDYPDLRGVMYPSAVYRRRDALIHVTLKKEYEGILVKNISKDVLRKFGHLEFSFASDVVNKKQNRYTCPVDYTDFIDMLCNQYEKFYIQEAENYKERVNSAYELCLLNVNASCDGPLPDSDDMIENSLIDRWCRMKGELNLQYKIQIENTWCDLGKNTILSLYKKSCSLLNCYAHVAYNLVSAPFFSNRQSTVVCLQKSLDQLIQEEIESSTYIKRNLETDSFKMIAVARSLRPQMMDAEIPAFMLSDEQRVVVNEARASVSNVIIPPRETVIGPLYTSPSPTTQIVDRYTKVSLEILNSLNYPTKIINHFKTAVIFEECVVHNKLLVAAAIQCAQSDVNGMSDLCSFYYYYIEMFNGPTNRSVSCKHFGMHNLRYVEYDVLRDMYIGEIIQRGNVTNCLFPGDCCNGFCILKVVPGFNKFINEDLLLRNTAMRLLLHKRRYEILPPYYRLREHQVEYSMIRSFLEGITLKCKFWWRDYLSPFFSKVYEFLKNWAVPILTGIMCIFTSQCLYKASSSIDIEMQRMTPQAPTNYSSIVKTAHLSQPVAVKSLSPQGGNQHIHNIIGCIKRNTFFLTCTNGSRSRTARCLLLYDREALVLRHYIEEFLGDIHDDDTYQVYLSWLDEFNNEHRKRIHINLSECVVKWFSYGANNTSNFGILTLPPRIPQSKSIVSHIASHQQLACPGTDFTYVRFPEGIQINTLAFKEKNYRITKQDNSSEVFIDSVFKYAIGGPGYCGSILISNILGKIVGVHVGGDKTIGIAEPIYSELFIVALSKRVVKDVFIPVSIMEDDYDTVPPMLNLETSIKMLGLVKSEFMHKESGITSIIPSIIQGVFPVRTEPNPLKTNDPRLYERVSPMKVGVEKHGLVTKQFNMDILHECYEDLLNLMKNSVLPVRGNVGKLSYQDAICGNINVPYFKSITWNTSEGFPLSSHRPHYASDKKWLFELSESSSGYKLEGMHPMLNNILEQKMNMRLNGIKPFTVFVDCLKDTTLPIEKCRIAGKTRIFSISPIDFTIHFRQYAQDFMASYQQARFSAEHAIGINIESREWTTLYERMSTKGTHIIASDYSNFGPGLNAEVAWYASKIIIEWYRHYGASEQHCTILEILFEEIICCKHLCFNIIYEVFAGIPSGSPITAPLNSIINCLYIRYMWRKIIPKRLNSFVNFYKHVALVTYGDDLIMNVSDEILPYFNQIVLSEQFGKYNIKFTDATKSDKLIESVTLDTCSFLKCKFVKHCKRNNVYIAALDRISIEGCANWIKKGGDTREASLFNSHACLNLAWGNGPDYYNTVYQTLTDRWMLNRAHFIHKTWKERDREIFDENSQGESLTEFYDYIHNIL